MENNQISLQENVANAFRERGIPVKRDDINAALADADACKWIENHLTPETLLSKEELTVYTKIEATGFLKGILHGQEISSTKPFLDDEIRKAIGSLKASTAAVEHQTETLKLQCKELKSQIRNGNQSRQRETKAWAQWKNKHALEKQQIDVAVEDLTHDFETTLSSMKSLLTTEAHTLLPQLVGKLKDDNQSLQSLEKMVSIIQIDTADKELSARATELTAKLSRYLVEEVHSRLDRVYIEYLQSNAPGIDEGDEEALATLQEEINSLYSEIEILSEMTTQQEYKVPILRALESSGAEVFDIILDLTQSTERITEKLNNRQSHQTALNYLATKYNCEKESKQSEGQAGKAMTPQKRLSRLSYMPSTPKDTDRKSSLSLPLDHGSKALEQLLRRLGVSTIDLVESGLTREASMAFDEKKQHMLETLQNLLSTADSPLSLYLGTADQAAQLLHSALYADSSFEIAMVDGTQDGKLGALERQIEVLRKGINGLDVGILHGGDKAQEKFMERWG
ncbi:predicted protein [Histoplasma mississippiense (nom. inval.)]|uniref:predicted protein n=1 Tax=Ajellomyces capsulatus (strain NAm1 / WU24) TaxID=2059318 RepID=UPI000157CF79|nr:predicted protein [Histoplasma mississippiense (nom. inval.)]EDN10970.1 predicted protein [Histoplasma mississippiense (nom. inval.)]